MKLKTVQLTKTWSSHRWLKAAMILTFSLIIGVIITTRVSLYLEPPQLIHRGQLAAQVIAQTADQSPEVVLASGAYIPDQGIILYSRLDTVDDAAIRGWVAKQLEAQSHRLQEMSTEETLTWIIDYGREAIKQTIIIAPITQADDASLYRFVISPNSSPPNPSSEVKNAIEVVTSTEPLQVEITPAIRPTMEISRPTLTPTVLSAPTDIVNPVSIIDSWGYTTTFEHAEGWIPFSGDWMAENGSYIQRDMNGYDYISIIEGDSLTNYTVETRFRYIEGEHGGGLIYNAPHLDRRHGAHLVDFTHQSSFIRWGYYNNDNGNFVYVGGTNLEKPINDAEWHTLRLVTESISTTIFLDDQLIATVENQSGAGRIGLVTSLATVEFDRVNVKLDPEQDAED